MLHRELGVGGATLMGLGSILGTGVFVSIGIAAGITGPSVVLAVAMAAVVATLNGLNSAQLAAAHPVSGGTYEYGYRFLGSRLGFTAGWVFLLAKSASAATAALGFAGYVMVLFGLDRGRGLLIVIGLAALAALTGLVLAGLRSSNVANAVIVAVTVGSLLVFVAFSAPQWDAARFEGFFSAGGPGLLEAAALMFVAYTGYGRIATMGEEVHHPRVTIPRAIVTTLVVTMVLYMAVAAAGVAAAGADAMAAATEERAAPLEVIARGFAAPGIGTVVAVGAVAAMLGVLLNLILGLSRVLLAMGRRRDVPGFFAHIDRSGRTPTWAVLGVAAVVAAIVAVGDVETTWSFSAFTVLLYYSITNLAALRISDDDRLFPRAIAWAGLAGCLGLAFWVDPAVWIAGLTLVAAGLVWHEVARRVRSGRDTAS
jgi:APA family basic amino acid/polyamine antiporter